MLNTPLVEPLTWKPFQPCLKWPPTLNTWLNIAQHLAYLCECCYCCRELWSGFEPSFIPSPCSSLVCLIVGIRSGFSRCEDVACGFPAALQTVLFRYSFMESPCTDFTLKGHMEIKDLLKNILNLKVQYVVLEEEILFRGERSSWSVLHLNKLNKLFVFMTE